MDNERDELYDDLDSISELKSAERATNQPAVHGMLGNLLRKVPGIADYIERNDHRKADQLLRDTIAGRLEEARLQLGEVYPALSRDIIMAMTYAEALGRSNTRLAGLIRKIESAPAGYSSMLAANKIDASALQQIYAFDERFFDHTMAISEAISTLDEAVNAGSGIDNAMSDLDATLRNANAAFEARQELLSGFSG